MRFLNDKEMNAIAGGTYVWPTSGGRVVIVHHVDEDGKEWDEEVWEADSSSDSSGGSSSGTDTSDQSKPLTEEQKASNERIRQAQKEADEEAEKVRKQEQLDRIDKNSQIIADDIKAKQLAEEQKKCTTDKTGDISTVIIKTILDNIPYIGKPASDELPDDKKVLTPKCKPKP